jgi:hypothetical protein
MIPDEAIVKAGTFAYAESVTCQLRIVRSSIRCGSGDYEDPPGTANDTEIESFYIEFGDPTEPTRFVARSGAYPSLPAAMLGAVEQLGSISWRHNAAGEA